jgi:hypothetical protein
MSLYLNIIDNALLNKTALKSCEKEVFHILLIGELLQIEGDLQG